MPVQHGRRLEMSTDHSHSFESLSDRFRCLLRERAPVSGVWRRDLSV
ncbi:hypothetical protein STXM2123_5211 [Streptomyces sp. F-3]|nr:hypothetical protein STXM2123_5211 [Streptomyces sp. F-3]